MECVLDGAGGSVCPLQVLDELRRGEEDAFGLRFQVATSNVHFQPKSCKVVVDQFHSLSQILSRAKWEGAVINVKAL